MKEERLLRHIKAAEVVFFYTKNTFKVEAKEMNEKLYKKTKKLLKRWGVTDEEADEFIKDLAETADDEDEGDGDGFKQKDVSEDLNEAERDVEESGEAGGDLPWANEN